jgi:hypothetical protein
MCPSLAKAVVKYYRIKAFFSAALAIACRSLILALTLYDTEATMSDELLDQAMLFEVVENQLADNYPKQVAETLMRLRMTGHSREDAIELIACALAPEMIDVIEHQQSFNLERYTLHLAQLPQTPWLGEDA